MKTTTMLALSLLAAAAACFAETKEEKVRRLEKEARESWTPGGLAKRKVGWTEFVLSSTNTPLSTASRGVEWHRGDTTNGVVVSVVTGTLCNGGSFEANLERDFEFDAEGKLVSISKVRRVVRTTPRTGRYDILGYFSSTTNNAPSQSRSPAHGR